MVCTFGMCYNLSPCHLFGLYRERKGGFGGQAKLTVRFDRDYLLHFPGVIEDLLVKGLGRIDKAQLPSTYMATTGILMSPSLHQLAASDFPHLIRHCSGQGHLHHDDPDWLYHLPIMQPVWAEYRRSCKVTFSSAVCKAQHPPSQFGQPMLKWDSEGCLKIVDMVDAVHKSSPHLSNTSMITGSSVRSIVKNKSYITKRKESGMARGRALNSLCHASHPRYSALARDIVDPISLSLVLAHGFDELECRQQQAQGELAVVVGAGAELTSSPPGHSLWDDWSGVGNDKGHPVPGRIDRASSPEALAGASKMTKCELDCLMGGVAGTSATSALVFPAQSFYLGAAGMVYGPKIVPSRQVGTEAKGRNSGDWCKALPGGKAPEGVWVVPNTTTASGRLWGNDMARHVEGIILPDLVQLQLDLPESWQRIKGRPVGCDKKRHLELYRGVVVLLVINPGQVQVVSKSDRPPHHNP
ncbi:hypothetical protein JCM1840_002578 [Sporobolomyces johnsonii]